jgi:ribosomal protein S18 acetylase RimI-like enzyme
LSTADTADLIARLHVESWRRVYRGLYSDRFLDVDALGERQRFWRQRLPELKRTGGEVFLAQVEGVAAGFACVEPGAGRAFIDNLHVLPAFQGRGLGVALVERCAAWARRRGYRQLVLYVFESNVRALGFYRATGWRIDGREMHPLVTEGEAPVLRMVKRIARRRLAPSPA